MASCSNPYHESAKWAKNEVDTFVMLMLDEVKKGNKTTTTFNKAGWNRIKNQLEAKIGRSFTMLQLRNKMNKLRADYLSFKKLLETSGFGWNVATRMCTVENDGVWDRHIKANPSWSKFRRNGLPQWPELLMIFGDSSTHGDIVIGNAEDAPNTAEEIDQDVDQSLPNTPFDGGLGDYDGGEAEDNPPFVNRRLDKMPSTIKKRNMTSDFEMACKTMADTSRAKTERHNSTSSTSPSPSPSPRPVSTDYSITQCMTVLSNMPKVGKDLYMKAVKRMMDDPHWREAFIACPLDKKMWLIEMLE
ncbi:uncharacterized protein LOC122091654 [Macadamia integrifolia]|uniref:uncharacterized protein LOC122091654 n=1 Tax=Macadamia integrifolia TaxID=60698 RepID=UPI001C4FA9BE|nr:uncharacterized protein LOC122091654 [Macadamia integrifolia]XP_042517630.1 uncharacterized protein LOC122091654 [Macadamia integrifolia]XP_042517631.1 uncharacterized protein LOC122091654 [Macadamia integrifolia]XP_042517632.1 uncharacterized protein LOC122091654 [Macadamia integrifolia]XP_042517633.1 uncharacterized protein LOC122091654 [Macadamia integrifolia]